MICSSHERGTALVAGGAGFLGSHLCEALLADSYCVTCVDNLHTGSKKNVAHLLDHDRFRFVTHDVVNPQWFDATHIFNLASPASPRHYQRFALHTIKSNVFGTANLLDLARQNQAKFLLASTSEVYGQPEVHPQPEWYRGNVNSFGPRACYDEGKRCAEALAYTHRDLGTDIRVARIFNTYGPRMALHDGRVVSNFITQALRGLPLTVYGDGQQTRSFCFVDDTIKAFLALMDSDLNEPCNIGNPVEVTMLELAQTVIDITASKSTIVHRELPPDDPLQRQPDITRAKKELGWVPQVALRDGLAQTVTYFKDALK